MKALSSLRVDDHYTPTSLTSIRAEARRFGAAYLCVCLNELDADSPRRHILPYEVYLGWENEDSPESMEEALSGGGYIVIREIL